MQLLGDAGPLCKTLFEPDVELVRQLTQAEAIQSNGGREADHDRHRLEPTHLPEHRPDLERQRRLRSVPQAFTVRRDDAKPILARQQV